MLHMHPSLPSAPASSHLPALPDLLPYALPPLPPPYFAAPAVEELSAECLGHAGLVYEHVLGEDKFTFVEDVRHPHSCTILIKGPNDYTIAQVGVWQGRGVQVPVTDTHASRGCCAVGSVAATVGGMPLSQRPACACATRVCLLF